MTVVIESHDVRADEKFYFITTTLIMFVLVCLLSILFDPINSQSCLWRFKIKLVLNGIFFMSPTPHCTAEE